MDRIIDNKRYIWYSSLSSELKMFYQKLMFRITVCLTISAISDLREKLLFVK